MIQRILKMVPIIFVLTTLTQRWLMIAHSIVGTQNSGGVTGYHEATVRLLRTHPLYIVNLVRLISHLPSPVSNYILLR
jgi:hypothetical protein